MSKPAIFTESFSSITSDQLIGVTGGAAVRPIFENGGVVGPRGSATPRPPIFEQGGVVGPLLGSPTPKPGTLLLPAPHHSIPESGGIVGPKGSPTPF
jgi:hypothetical protein